MFYMLKKNKKFNIFLQYVKLLNIFTFYVEKNEII